ncbi:MAG: hypothetical protein IPM85_11165 [Chitinophagaceae bacterium]|nr:hypothetical protein [Chitinophagaceae bacterium]
MKKLLILCMVFVTVVYTSGQTPIIITPGEGIGNLKLGMNEKETMAILSGTVTWGSYKEQLKSFIDYNTSIDSVMQFVLGFDSCAKYNSTLPDSMPVFALYFKKHKLNFITITSYSADEDMVKRVKIKNGLTYYNTMEECIKKLGKDYINVSYSDYTGDLYYYKKGLELVFDENRLRSIAIFPPTPQFIQLQKQKSKKLREEARQTKI